MKKLMVLGGALAVALLTGCVSTHTNDGTTTVKVPVVTKPFTADVVAQEKTVSGDATVHNVLGFITWGVSEFADDAFVTTSNSFLPQLGVNPVEAAKQGATYKACEASKSDAILAAKYKLNISDFVVYKKVNCKVTGYPAAIKGVKK